jgi:1-phosphofructokinase
VEHADWVVLSGSLPPGMPMDAYATMTRRAQAAGAAVLLDTSGAPLKAALATGPRLVKPNRQELAELVHRPLDTLEAVIAAGREVLNNAPQRRSRWWSRWARRALCSSPANTRCRRIHYRWPSPARSEPGTPWWPVWWLPGLRGCSLTETAQLATAFAAAKLTRLAPHLPPPDEVRALARQVTCQP